VAVGGVRAAAFPQARLSLAICDVLLANGRLWSSYTFLLKSTRTGNGGAALMVGAAPVRGARQP
jgi:hypothetical protein